MAIIKVDQFVADAPVDTSDWAGHSAHIVAFINQVNNQQWHLTNPFNTTEPALAQGAYINHGGTLYVVDTADETISGSPADGDVYVKLSVSGDNLVASYITDISGYSWNHSENNLYNAGDIVLPYRIVKSGIDWGKMRLVRQDVALHGDLQVDGTADFTGNATVGGTLGVDGTVDVTGALSASTLNTGQGNNQLYRHSFEVYDTADYSHTSTTVGSMIVNETKRYEFRRENKATSSRTFDISLPSSGVYTYTGFTEGFNVSGGTKIVNSSISGKSTLSGVISIRRVS